MTSHPTRLVTQNGRRVADLWSGVVHIHQAPLREEYKKTPIAVYNRLIVHGMFEELHELINEFGKPKQVLEFEDFEDKGLPKQLVMDLKNFRDTFEGIAEFAKEEAAKLNMLLLNEGSDDKKD